LRANVIGIKNSYRRLLPAKLYTYLGIKRKRKDSLGIKPSFIQFLKSPNPTFNPVWLATNTAQIQRYYRENGFLKAHIQSKIDTIGQLVNVTFAIDEGEASYFTKQDSISVDNPILAEHVGSYLKENSVIRPMGRLQLSLLKKEKEQLSHHLRNEGYYYFSPDAVGIRLNDVKDSTLQRISLYYKIPEFKNHLGIANYDRLYRIGLPEFSISDPYGNPAVHPPLKGLSKLINLKEDDLYSVDLFNQSLKNIYLTDQFKTVSIRFDTTRTRLFPKIELFQNEKYNFSSELGGSVFRGIPGPFLTNSFKVRRLFSSLDYFDFSTRIGYEAQSGFINTADTRNNLELNVAASINFPTLYLPKTIIGKLGSYFGAKTSVGVGFDFINRPEYQRTNVNLFQRYTWQKSEYSFFTFSLINLNLLNTIYPETATSDAFRSYLEELKNKGNNLYRSFNPSFVSSISFQYVYRDLLPSNELKNGKIFQIGLESGGTTLNLLPTHKFSFVTDVLNSGQDIQFYRFLRFNLDYRKYKMLGRNQKSQIAFKLAGGVAYAYGDENGYQLPYEKNFFIGGPSSVRAWKPRRLGPGSYVSSSNLVEQPGSILLESSLEYRFKLFPLFGQMNGAFFVDAGNVWNMTQGNTDPSTQFHLSDFYNQIAVGTGFGLRWDFDFFLLRLDLATKVINPANPVNQKWVLPQTSFEGGQNPIEYNIGIGYPF
ncbi:MAG: BamA/TamA family outer membrane protein, partial [Cytophagales bacterium]|nr:BamA/TamA family outer membrane protein [Cytophagales bacterium]